MNYKCYLLSSLAVIVLILLGSTEANAQGARYKFPPKYWLKEQVAPPPDFFKKTVRDGSVPNSASYLLGEPSEEVLSPVIGAPSLQGQRIASRNPAFSPTFGVPISISPINLNARREAAIPAKKLVVQHIKQIKRVHAKLRKTSPASSRTTQELASYSTGYAPGGFLPSSSETKSVKGRVILGQ